MERNKILKAIWAKAKKLRLYNSKSSKDDIKDSELYTLLYSQTQKYSMKECTDEELMKVLDTLKLFEQQDEANTGKITERQKGYIKHLTQKLKWDNPKRLKGFIKKYTGVDRIEWLSPKQASNIIEGLKNLLRSESNEQK